MFKSRNPFDRNHATEIQFFYCRYGRVYIKQKSLIKNLSQYLLLVRLLKILFLTKMRTSYQFIIIISVLVGFTVNIINSKVYTIQLDEAKFLNSSYLEGYYNLSRLTVSKFNRSTFVMNVDLELLVDLNDDYFFDTAYYSKKIACHSWSKNLYYWKNQSQCLVLETFRYFAVKGYNNTNVPLFKKDEQCLLRKVN